MSQQALISLMAIVLLPLVCHINFAQTKITFIEVKFPLLVILFFILRFSDRDLKMKMLNLLKGKESAPGMPWPKPQFMQVAANMPPSFLCMIKSQFSIGSSLVGCDLIEKNILHYMNVIFPPKLYVEELCDLTQHRALTKSRSRTTFVLVSILLQGVFF